MDQQTKELIQLLEGRLQGAQQIREIEPIERWLESPYFVGEDGLYLYDYWKQELTDFIISGHPEWIQYGSLGSGKTTAAIYALLRKIYELSCFEPIPFLWQLMRSTTIFFVYFSISLTQANRTGYGKFYRALDVIPYFQKHFQRDQNITSEIKFRNVSVVYGSSASHQIGLDLLGAVLDEGDFYEVKGSGQQEFSIARDIYTSLINRRKLRFSIAGRDTGLSILASSPAYGTDFVQKRIDEARRTGTAHISEPVGFKISRGKFAVDTFPVFPGSEDVDPHLLDNTGDVTEVAESLGLALPAETLALPYKKLIAKIRDYFEVFDVPEDLREPFDYDLPKAVRDILGRSLKPVAVYMTLKEYAKVYWPCMRHPFTKQVLSISTKNEIRIEDFLREELLYDKEIPRFIHIDQSVTTDRTGIACSFLASDVPEIGYPDVVVEWQLALAPPAQGEIPILRIAEFVGYLQDLGYRIGRVTMDSYQSRASIQYLEAEGIDSETMSVDRDDEAYILIRNLIANDALHSYHYPISTKEITNVLWDRRKRKVDHPKHETKDVTDAIAGSVKSAIDYGDLLPTVETIAPSVEAMKQNLLYDPEANWEEI